MMLVVLFFNKYTERDIGDAILHELKSVQR